MSAYVHDDLLAMNVIEDPRVVRNSDSYYQVDGAGFAHYLPELRCWLAVSSEGTATYVGERLDNALGWLLRSVAS